MMTDITHDEWFTIKKFVDLLGARDTNERVYILDTVLSKYCPTCGQRCDYEHDHSESA
jgi:hypothetical protein